MRLDRHLSLSVLAHTALLFGISPILPVTAQEGEPPAHGRIVIKTPNGEQVIELDGSQLPPPGSGAQMIIVDAGPNGEFNAYVGSPDMFFLPGGDGFSGDIGASRNAYAGLNIIDPGTSYLYALLKRVDVAEEIHLNARQREALDSAVTNQQELRKQQLKEGIQLGPGNIEGKSKDELTALFTERAQKMRDQQRMFSESRAKALATILKPAQLDRLKQLDLQFRGPMAMGVDEVATSAALNKDQSAKVSGILREYRQDVRKNLGFGAQTVTFRPGAEAAPPVTSAPPPDSEAERARLVKADKEIRKSRQTLGAKALASLPDPQRAQWMKLTGKPFEFHPAL